MGAPERRMQLLRLGWFPSSLHCPTTAFTFDFLNTFDHVNTQGKTNTYDFYYAISHKTDNAGLLNLKVCLPVFFLR